MVCYSLGSFLFYIVSFLFDRPLRSRDSHPFLLFLMIGMLTVGWKVTGDSLERLKVTLEEERC